MTSTPHGGKSEILVVLNHPTSYLTCSQNGPVRDGKQGYSRTAGRLYILRSAAIDAVCIADMVCV